MSESSSNWCNECGAAISPDTSVQHHDWHRFHKMQMDLLLQRMEHYESGYEDAEDFETGYEHGREVNW